MSAPLSYYGEDFLSSLAEEWQKYQQALEASSELRDFLAADHSVDEKKQLLRQVFQGQLDPFLLSWLGLLLEQGRLQQGAEIAAMIRDLLKRWRDTLTVHLTTATALPAEEEETLLRTLRQQYGCEIVLEKTIDPGLIGGAVLRIGDKLFDASIKSQLHALQRDLLK